MSLLNTNMKSEKEHFAKFLVAQGIMQGPMVLKALSLLNPSLANQATSI